jgi:hypothetical protein
MRSPAQRLPGFDAPVLRVVPDAEFQPMLADGVVPDGLFSASDRSPDAPVRGVGHASRRMRPPLQRWHEGRRPA